MRLGTQALQTTEGRGRRLQRHRERKTVNVGRSHQRMLFNGRQLFSFTLQEMIVLTLGEDTVFWALHVPDRHCHRCIWPPHNRERCSLDTRRPLVCMRGGFSSSQLHHKHLKIKSVLKCLAAWFHSSRRGLIALGCFTKPLYSKLSEPCRQMNYKSETIIWEGSTIRTKQCGSETLQRAFDAHLYEAETM